MQVGAQVIGNDAVITFSAASGNFELNTMMPVMASNLLQPIELPGNGSRVFSNRCVQGLEADVEYCQRGIERSLALCIALATKIRYDQAARIAKLACESGRTVREVAREVSQLDEATLERLQNPRNQTGS